MPPFKLVVGLGNPGAKYQFTRHNIGFLAVDAFLEEVASQSASPREKYGGEFYTLGTQAECPPYWLKPQTFMNLSGESVQPCLQGLKIAPVEMLVIHDELDLPEGTLRLKQGGGAGGHNGLRSIIEAVGGDFWRLRIGVGKPSADFRGGGADWVLAPFPHKVLDSLVEQSVKALQLIFAEGTTAAMQKLHTKIAE